MNDPSAPKGSDHGQPKNMDQPPVGAQQGLAPGDDDPLNMREQKQPRPSPAPRPNPRIQPAAEAAERRRRGGS